MSIVTCLETNQCRAAVPETPASAGHLENCGEKVRPGWSRRLLRVSFLRKKGHLHVERICDRGRFDRSWMPGAGAAEFGRGEPQAQATAKDDPKPKPEKPSIADPYKQILKEFEGEQQKLSEAIEKAKTEAETMQIYDKMTPDDTKYSRRMVDLAETSPKDPASRDALVWVLNKLYRSDGGTYGDQVARAVRLLVQHHANDPEAVRVGLMLNNVFSRNRDALMEGMYASAEGREAKGLARIALAQYLERKILMVKSSHKLKTRQTYTYDTFEDGKPVKKTVSASNEEEGYRVGLRLIDPESLEREVERLYAEVISEYGDIPYITSHQRKLEELLKEPAPKWNNKPLTADEIKQLKDRVNKTKTLAQVAEGHLDEMHNLTEGKPAPEIDGKDIERQAHEALRFPRQGGRAGLLGFVVRPVYERSTARTRARSEIQGQAVHPAGRELQRACGRCQEDNRV